MSRNIDMTRGRMLPLVIRFAIPLCLGNVLQQLYNTADAMVVGNWCGAQSLAAVATSGQPVELLVHLFIGMGSGVSILTAQYTGSGEGGRLRSLLNTAVGFLYLCSLALTALGLVVGPHILRWMQVPSDVLPYALDYLRIIFLGTLASIGYNMNAGVLRGLGDSRSSLYFLVISCVTNIVLDLLFVAGLGMDVAGAAAATVISQYLSWALSIVYIRKKYPDLSFPLLPRRMEKALLGELTRIGVPLGVNNSFYSVGHLLMQSLINTQGAAFIAGCSVAGKVMGMANVAISSLSMAATTFAGQNWGAKQYRRVLRSTRIPLLSGLITLVAAVPVLAFATPVLGLFTSDAAVLSYGRLYLWVVLPFCCVYAVFNGIIALANGIGEVRYPTVVNILMLWVVRIPVGHLIAAVFGGQYVMAAISVSFIFGLAAMLLFYRSHRWREVRTLAQAQTTGAE